MNNKNSKIQRNEISDEKLYSDPEKLLEFTQRLLEKQLTLTKEVEEKCEALRKKNIHLECQNEVIKARYELVSKENALKDRGNKMSQSDSLLEDDMLKAQISSSILKAVVTPLEDEIVSLKKRLSEAETRLNISYVRAITTFPEVSIDESSTTDITDNANLHDENSVERIMELEIFCSELKKKLFDSEVYVVALSRQKDEYESQVKILENELNDVKDLLKNEEAKSAELKQTWEKANEQFILESLNFQAEMKRIQGNTKNIDSSRGYTLDSSSSFKSLEASNMNENTDCADKFVLLQSEIESLKLELENEKRKYAELDESVPVTLQSSLDHLEKSQSDFEKLDSFLVEIQEEFVSLLSQIDMKPPSKNIDVLQPSFDGPQQSSSPNFSEDSDLVNLN